MGERNFYSKFQEELGELNGHIEETYSGHNIVKSYNGIDKEIEGEAIPYPNIKIGYLPQEPQFDLEKTVKETVKVIDGLNVSEFAKFFDETSDCWVEK